MRPRVRPRGAAARPMAVVGCRKQTIRKRRCKLGLIDRAIGVAVNRHKAFFGQIGIGHAQLFRGPCAISIGIGKRARIL